MTHEDLVADVARDQERLTVLEERVRELQTAVSTIVRHLGIEHDVLEAERARLDEIRLLGEPDAPRKRLMELYETGDSR
jgi:hypothetical protein